MKKLKPKELTRIACTNAIKRYQKKIEYWNNKMIEISSKNLSKELKSDSGEIKKLNS